MFTRTRYQNGSLSVKERKNGERVWEFRFYETDPFGVRRRRSITVGSVRQYPTESAARKGPAFQAVLLRINAEGELDSDALPFGALLARYEQEEMPARHSTRCSYQSCIRNYIRPRWCETPINMIKPLPVEDWLKKLPLAPKTRSHLRGLMHTIFECAVRWELAPRNPIALVRVKGGSKRLRPPMILTIDQFHAVLCRLAEPHRTMALMAGCLGLRVSEIVGLQWTDFDFEKGTLLVERSVVHGRVDDVKTEYSRDQVPLDPALTACLLAYRPESYPTREGWLFASPQTGRPFHQDSIQQDYIRPAGRCAGLGDNLGWHTFRHSYRSWLDDVGAPIGVQKELMRHASIQTTMNVYGKAMTDSKRQANSKVVRMILPGDFSRQATSESTPVAKVG